MQPYGQSCVECRPDRHLVHQLGGFYGSLSLDSLQVVEKRRVYYSDPRWVNARVIARPQTMTRGTFTGWPGEAS